ncbi:MAG: hypothetical protein FWG52_08970 [Proteobacteria bacterium]|nr:hypothetical protein [Pseudomonadota bacterium]
MRLLSIFALLFLISFLLHGGLKDWAAPEKPAGQDVKEAVEAVEVAEATDTAEAAATEPVQPEQEDFSSLIFSQPYPVRHFDFEQEPVFNASTIELEIKNLIIGREDDSFKVKNHLCAVGYEFPRRQQGKKKDTARKEVVVYWREGKMLYRWKGGDPKAAERDFYDARSLMFSRSVPLDPNQGVVEAEDAEGRFDNYKERAENVIADCERHGKPYEIEPFAPPPRGFKRPEGGGRPRPTPAEPPTPATSSSSPLV